MKPFLFWRDDWLLGLQNLDEQHLQVADAINDLHQSIIHQQEKSQHINTDQINRQLSDLAELARCHFKDEEALMRAHNYPGLAEHHREHRLLMAELHAYLREIEAGTRPFSLATLTALKHWQINHVIYSDKMFADYLRQQSRSANEDDYDTIAEAQIQTG
ncbi:MAG: bacteriohemerythrin [Candidatus Thiodiazotropha sp.]